MNSDDLGRLSAALFSPGIAPTRSGLPRNNVSARHGAGPSSCSISSKHPVLRLVGGERAAEHASIPHEAPVPAKTGSAETSPVIVAVLDEEASNLEHIARPLQGMNLQLELFSQPSELLLHRFPVVPMCLVASMSLQEMNGLDLQKSLRRANWYTSIVFLSKDGDLPTGIQAMQRGAIDVIGKPLTTPRLVEAVSAAISTARSRLTQQQSITDLADRVSSLTRREGEVMMLVAQGLLNKQIAATLGISLITTKMHRGRMMKKMGLSRVPELVRVVDALANAGRKLPRAIAAMGHTSDIAFGT